jgi:hypothetical protein
MMKIKIDINWCLKWLATVFTVAGALAVSLDHNDWDVGLLFVGSVLWLVWALRIGEWSIVTVNATMIVIYTYGLVIRML